MGRRVTPYIGRFAYVAPGVVVPPQAVIRGEARIEKQDDLLVIGPLHGQWFTAHRDAQIGVRVVRTVHHGSVPDYEARVEKCCAGNQYKLEAFRGAIAWIKEHFNL
jgi:hypothetical protein